MKIICDNCRTKYSIADEKVKGKVFKIRCKKCQNIIVVRGNQDSAEEPAAEGPAAGEQAGPAGGETPVWHLVIGRDQVGPMTHAEVRERFSKGEINSDTYIWREGFTDWVRIPTVDEFADLGQAAAAALNVGVANQAAAEWDPAAREPEAPAAQPAWDANAGAGAEAAWSASAADPGASWQAGGGVHAEGIAANQPRGGGGHQDLFAFGGGGSEGAAAGGAEASYSQNQPAQDPMPAGQGLFQSPASGSDIFGGGSNGGGQLFPSEDEQPSIQMKGARHENSVLFSLSNLQALAMGGKSAAPSPAPSSSSLSPAAGRVGSSGMDGSGLIDIRSMASPTTTAPMSSGGMDDLPDLGGFSAPIAAAPVLMPAITDERPKWLLPTIIGVGGALVVAIVVLVLVLVLKEDKPPMLAAVTPAAGTAAAVGAPAAPAAASGTVAATEAKGEDKAAVEGEADKDAADDEGQAKAQASRRQSASRRQGRRAVSRASVAEAASSAEPRRTSVKSSAAAKPKKAGGDELDALIDSAIHGEGPKKPTRQARPAAASPDANLPETLSRGQIQGGMQSIKASVQGCYDRFRVPGLALTHVVIGQNGRIGSVRVKGVFAGTPTGACVASAVKSASFPKFKGQPISIEYPFQLR